MSAVTRVAVIGGGISGLTTALALRRAGTAATVYERAPVLDGAQAGNGLVVWHNAVRALESIGMRDRLHQIGQVLERYEFRSWKGGRLADWSIAQGAERTGAPTYTVSRPALHRLLSDAVGDDLVLGARFVGYDTDSTGVTARFEGGREERADLLVGADGLRSTVRRQLMPCEPPPRYARVTAWQGVVAAGSVPGDGVPSGTFVNTFGRGRWFVYYCLPGGLVYWDGVISDRISRRIDAFGESGKSILAREFENWPEPIPSLVGATPPGDIAAVDIFDRDPVDRWSADRVTLVGDAAHPMTFNLGQGANQAVEGGVVLGGCLAEASELATALAAYEHHRIERARQIVRRSRANGRFSRWSNPAVCVARDAFMRVAFDRLIYSKTYDLTMDMRPAMAGSTR